NFETVHHDILRRVCATCSGDSNFQVHRFAQRSFRTIQNRCHARRISLRKLRRCDYSEDSDKNSAGCRHLKVHLASIIPSRVAEGVVCSSSPSPGDGEGVSFSPSPGLGDSSTRPSPGDGEARSPCCLSAPGEGEGVSPGCCCFFCGSFFAWA